MPPQPADGDALAFSPIHVLTERLNAGELTAATLVDCFLQRIRRYDTKLHAFVDTSEDAARAAADAADRKRRQGGNLGPLHGIPIALKDLVHVAGMSTSGGSAFRRNQIANVTATVARRLTDAGAILIGKTHMVEFAFGSWGTNSAMGTPWNPWDAVRHRVPGGSSSGSGVAVAAGLVPAALGSDTGGSVRIPAALCGVVGLKTTVGRVSNHGVLMLSHTLDTLGPLTRDVEDAALLLSVMQGADRDDPATLAHAPVDAFTQLKSGVAGMKLGVLPEADLGEIAPDVSKAFAAALDALRALGAEIVEVSFPVSYLSLAEVTGRLIAAEGYALTREWIDRDDLPFDTAVRDRLRAGKAISESEHAALIAEQKRLQHAVAPLLEQCDALLTPTIPLPAVTLEEVDQSRAPMSLFTRPVNLLGLCALSLPCGFTAGGLPLSLQIIGRPYEEARILRVGFAYEKATGWHTRRPPLP